MATIRNSCLLMFNAMMLLMVAACSQGNENLQQSGQNQQMEKRQFNIQAEGRSSDSPILPKEVFEEATTFDPVVLFELTDDDLKKQVTELPYYSSGNMEFITDETIRRFSEGQISWRGDPIKAAEVLTQNLIPEGIPAEQVSYNVIVEENESQTDKLTIVEKNVPDVGTFTIHLLVAPESGGMYLISKIVWQPADSESMQKLKNIMKEPFVIYDLREEEHFGKDVQEFPNYQNGRIWFSTDADIESLGEGHSPWRTVPEIVAESYTRGLIPGDISQDGVSYETIRKEGNLTTVAVIVPTFGAYEITLIENLFEIITKITFLPE